jgi:hypothetical protein
LVFTVVTAGVIIREIQESHSPKTVVAMCMKKRGLFGIQIEGTNLSQ